MSQVRQAPPFPRNILIIVGATMLLSIMTAAAGRINDAANSSPTAAPIASRELVFKDREDGSVVIFDAQDTSVPIDIAAPATNGFLRATMRGLARQRLRQDADREIPFRLTAWADGRLTLEDPTTGRRVEMEAFGITNAQVFANLLTAKAGS